MVYAFFTASIIIWLYMTILSIFAHIKHDNSIVDIGWGIGFILITLTILTQRSSFSIIHFLITGMICIWGIRLSTHIFLRHRGKPEDYRYATMRNSWKSYPFLHAYTKIFILQGVIMLMIASSIIVILTAQSSPDLTITFIGIILWSVGFYFEAVGDYQLKQFIHDSKNSGRIMKTGLWKYTRHPNYFGELLMWWSLWVIASTLPFGIFAIISPLLLTYLLLYVSGIPLLEKPFENNSEFKEYKKQTNALIPWFPKR